MLLNGSRVAEHLVKLKYPCLLRVHNLEHNEDQKTQEMIDYVRPLIDESEIAIKSGNLFLKKEK